MTMQTKTSEIGELTFKAKEDMIPDDRFEKGQNKA